MQDQLNKKFSSFVDSKNYRGYFQSEEPKIDNVLVHIGPGSSCGEFFRRYWHPVALSSEVNENPKSLKILGENLVLFRTANGELAQRFEIAFDVLALIWRKHSDHILSLFSQHKHLLIFVAHHQNNT